MKFQELSTKWLKRTLVNKSFKHSNDLNNRIKHLNRMIGEREISKIKWIDFEDELIEFSKLNPNTNKKPSQKLMRNIFNTANNIMNYAYDLELINRNPFLYKTPPKGNPKKYRRSLNNFEQELILTTEHRFQLVALIMIFTGLRVGECIPLEWKDIDFIKKCIVVNKSTMQVSSNEYEIKENTKNTKSRVVTMPDILIRFLINEKRNSTSNYITTAVNGNLHTPSSFKQAWESYYKTLNYNAYIKNFDSNLSYFDPQGIPIVLSNITPHILRHTYATLLYDADVDVLTAQKLLGHSDVNTTLAIYTHLSEEKKILGIKKFNEFINNNL